jgi:hypothetical protein
VVVSFLVFIITTVSSKIDPDQLDIWQKRGIFYSGAFITTSWIVLMTRSFGAIKVEEETTQSMSIQQFIIYSIVTILTIWVIFTPLFGLEISMLVVAFILLWVSYWSRFIEQRS